MLGYLIMAVIFIVAFAGAFLFHRQIVKNIEARNIEAKKQEEADNIIKKAIGVHSDEFAGLVIDDLGIIQEANEKTVWLLFKNRSVELINTYFYDIPFDYNFQLNWQNVKDGILLNGQYTQKTNLFEKGRDYPVVIEITDFEYKNKPCFLVRIFEFDEIYEKDELIVKQAQRLEEIQHIAKLGYWEVFHLENRIEWSKELYTLLGYEYGEIKPNLDLLFSQVEKDDREYVNRSFLTAFRNQKGEDLEHKLVNCHGEIITVQVRLRHFFNEDNALESTIGVVQDVTENINLKANILDKEKQIKLYLNVVNDGVWEYDLVENKTYISTQLRTMLGVDYLEINNYFDEILEFIHEEDRKQVIDYHKHFIRSFDDVYECQYRVITGEGIIKWIYSKGVAERNDVDDIVNVMGINRDITAVVAVNEKLNYERNLSQALINRGSFALLMINEQGRIININPYLEKILGKPRVALRGEMAVSIADMDMVRQSGGTRSYQQFFEGIIPLRNVSNEIKQILWQTISLVDENKNNIKVCLGVDVTESEHYKKRVEYLAFTDTVTRLPKREKFYRDFDEYIREEPRSFAMVRLQLGLHESTKVERNDLMDMLMFQVAKRIKTVVNERAQVYCFNQRQFLLLGKGIGSSLEVDMINGDLVNSFREPVIIEHKKIFVGINMGIVMYPEDGDSMEMLLERTNLAMRAVKDSDQYYRYFNEDMSEEKKRLEILNQDLFTAIEKEEITVHYQSINSLQDNRVRAYEGLLRWTHPKLGEISPYEIISIAKRSGYISKLGDYVIIYILNSDITRELLDQADIKIHINVFYEQISHPDFIYFLADAFETYKIDSNRIVFEIEESDIVRNPVLIRKRLEAINLLGIDIAVSNLGGKGGSMVMTLELPVKIMKFGNDITKKIFEDKSKQVFIKNMVTTMAELEKRVVITGIETKKEFDYFSQYQVEGQGYYISYPREITMEEVNHS
jgi:predicted signal transduction protein with EAL and GGDEF domain